MSSADGYTISLVLILRKSENQWAVIIIIRIVKHYLYPALRDKQVIGLKKTSFVNRKSLRTTDLLHAVVRQSCGLFRNLWVCLYIVIVLAHIKGVALIRYLQHGGGEPALC
jgi:hypothetical protein